MSVFVLFYLIRVANADEGTELGALVRLPDSLQLLPLLPPPLAVQVDTGWRAEESLLIAVTFLSHLGVQHHHHHVTSDARVAAS